MNARAQIDFLERGHATGTEVRVRKTGEAGHITGWHIVLGIVFYEIQTAHGVRWPLVDADIVPLTSRVEASHADSA